MPDATHAARYHFPERMSLKTVGLIQPTTPQASSAPAPAVAGAGDRTRHTAATRVTAEGPACDLGELVVRRAALGDVPAMHTLINGFARQNRMLFRSEAELKDWIDEYQVALRGEELLGVCGLHPVAGGLAEVRGLAVSPVTGGQGVGRRLVEACISRARALGIAKAYTLTLVPGFFEKLGFYQVDKGTLHLKVWYECYRCPKFANCDEMAMVRPLDLEPDPPKETCGILGPHALGASPLGASP